MFSVLPSYTKSSFGHYADKDFYCLPEILKDNGYETLFFQAYKDVGFGNKFEFLSRNGFDKVESVSNHMKPGDEKHVWGWGLQDDVYYKRFFDYFDSIKSEKPIFASLLTVSTHMKFKSTPDRLKKIFPGYSGRSYYKRYANTVHAADGFLKTFMEELKKRDLHKNSIVIITGDHSFPLDEHGSHHNEAGAFNENFRTPFLLLWDDKVLPKNAKDYNYSHLDILPTVLDLAGLDVSAHTAGQSMFTEPVKNRPIFLAQPYQGVVLAIVRGDFKYINEVRYGRESLFNLKNDPGERSNIINNEEHKTLIEQFREDLGWFFVTNKRLDDNKIFKKKKAL